MPAVARIRGDEPVTASTAILLCTRNESPERMIRNLEPMLAGLDAAGLGERFHLYVLSDTSDAAIADNEEACFASLIERWRDRVAITYRRRAVNTGFKAGNIREFCERWGRPHHAGGSQARHSPGADRRSSVDQRLRAGLSVRHAAWHALLHHWQRLVAG